MRPFKLNRLTFQRFVNYFIFLLGLNASLFAAEYGFDVWTTATGLPQNTVTGVVQTSDGYLWISTFDGLARFDGVRFTIFDKGNTKGIVNNRFAGIFVGKDGAIWAWTENGGLTVYRAGVFTSYDTPEGLHEGIFGLAYDEAGNLLLETKERFHYLQDGKLVPVPEQKENGVRVIYYGKSGAKWIVETNRVIQQKDGRTTVYSFETESDWLSYIFGVSPFEDKTGALWIRVNGRIANFRDGAVKIYTAREIPALKELGGVTFFEDKDDNVFVIVPNYNSSKPAKLIGFKSDKLTVSDLETPGLRSPVLDTEGNIWFASPTGLRRMRRQIINTLSVKEGLSGNEVYPLLQTRRGDIYIGSSAGLNRYANGEMQNLNLQYAYGASLYMRSLWEDSHGRVWVGFLGNGGFGRLEESDSVKRLPQNDLPSGATDFASDREGNIWIATEEGLFEYKDDQKIAHYTVKDGLRNDKIITLHFDRSGNLWLGTFDGLSVFKDGKFINYNRENDSPKGFVRAIYEDAEGILWFGTYSDGLVRYKDGKFFNYRAENGLFNNGVFAILEDNRGNFWMSSNRGIYRLARQELDDFAGGRIPKLNSVSYDEKDGMLNAECNGGRMPAAFKAKDGKLWFATMGGVAIVDPEAEQINPNPPPVVIENIAVDRQQIEAGLLQSKIQNPQSKIEIQPGQTNLEITYAGLSLIKSAQIKFKYQLKGFEENWTEAGTTRTANYSYLPAGDYTFHVLAANANGVWNNQGASVKIIVYPYFYQTWWFRVLATLAVAAIIWLIYHSRVSHLREIAETKTQFSRQLIESQEKERKRISAELHDGLGQNLVVIKNRATLGLKKGEDKERVAKELTEISESAARALEEVREITNDLRPQLIDRLGLTKALTAMCRKISGIIEIDCDIDSIEDVFSEIEEISIYRIVQESLNNIIKHSNASNAYVMVKRSENNVLITITDNGKGFDIIDAKSEGGLGLVGLKERTQLLNGEFSIDSEVNKGTKIKIIINAESHNKSK